MPGGESFAIGLFRKIKGLRKGNPPAHLVAGPRRGPGLPPSGPPPQIPSLQTQQLQQQRSPDELRHQAIHQLQEESGGGDTSPRHSIASNTSSNLSSPPSPGHPPLADTHHSSSYES
ncbi:hypothetical protein FHG87_013138 [Trinorchestia longiramus]|nr:hypothetical protein FHG87_013138 [Trinorchestia longiramus]